MVISRPDILSKFLIPGADMATNIILTLRLLLPHSDHMEDVVVVRYFLHCADTCTFGIRTV